VKLTQNWRIVFAKKSKDPIQFCGKKPHENCKENQLRYFDNTNLGYAGRLCLF
jgi:hypothetical protein